MSTILEDTRFPRRLGGDGEDQEGYTVHVTFRVGGHLIFRGAVTLSDLKWKERSDDHVLFKMMGRSDDRPT